MIRLQDDSHSLNPTTIPISLCTASKSQQELARCLSAFKTRPSSGRPADEVEVHVCVCPSLPYKSIPLLQR
ncbi:hypothetical protein Mapa_002171 [Marchantia paleacea]|nr:hypothetical protein Mapa_002171 [Marchantia paleacea]